MTVTVSSNELWIIKMSIIWGSIKQYLNWVHFPVTLHHTKMGLHWVCLNMFPCAPIKRELTAAIQLHAVITSKQQCLCHALYLRCPRVQIDASFIHCAEPEKTGAQLMIRLRLTFRRSPEPYTNFWLVHIHRSMGESDKHSGCLSVSRNEVTAKVSWFGDSKRRWGTKTFF